MVTFPWDRGLNPNHHPRVTVDLQVDIVPSIGRHSQFSIMVLHAACKMAVRESVKHSGNSTFLQKGQLC